MVKTKSILKGMAGVFILSIVFLACDKEEVRPEFKQMTFESGEVLEKLPSGLVNSSDEHAEECMSMIHEALDMSDFADDMNVPDGAVKTSKKSSGDTWTWTVDAQGYTYTFYWTYSEDATKHYWTMEVQVDGGAKHAYIQAWENKDGRAGQVKYNFNWTAAIYGTQEYEDIFWTYSWSLDASDNYNFTMTWDSGDGENDFYLEYIVVVNNDGSGSIEYWLMDSLVYKMQWDAEGNGTWVYYSGGEELMSGSWSAA